MEIKNLNEALKRITELEKELAVLRAENKQLKERNFGGRKKHDSAWTASYNDFVIKLEKGLSISEIAANSDISKRTAYRYLEYYNKINRISEKASESATNPHN